MGSRLFDNARKLFAKELADNGLVSQETVRTALFDDLIEYDDDQVARTVQQCRLEEDERPMPPIIQVALNCPHGMSSKSWCPKCLKAERTPPALQSGPFAGGLLGHQEFAPQTKTDDVWLPPKNLIIGFDYEWHRDQVEVTSFDSFVNEYVDGPEYVEVELRWHDPDGDHGFNRYLFPGIAGARLSTSGSANVPGVMLEAGVRLYKGQRDIEAIHAEAKAKGLIQ